MSLYGYTKGGESLKGKMLVTQTKEFVTPFGGKPNTKNYNIGDVVSVDVSKTTMDRGDYFTPIYFIDGIRVREGNEFKFIEKNPYKDFEYLNNKGAINEKEELLQQLELAKTRQIQDKEAKKVRKKYIIYGLIAVAGYFAYKKFKK